MEGTTSNSVTISAGASITDVTTTSHGGLFYLNAPTQTVTLSDMSALRVTSSGEGGILFSSTSTTSLTSSILYSSFIGVNAIS